MPQQEAGLAQPGQAGHEDEEEQRDRGAAPFPGLLYLSISILISCLPPCGALGYVKMLVPSVGAWWGSCPAPDVLCGQGAGTGGPEPGPSLALQLPDLAAIQRDPAKCYFLNTPAFHNNLTTLLSFTSSLKRELDSFWLIYTDCIWKPSETEL